MTCDPDPVEPEADPHNPCLSDNIADIPPRTRPESVENNDTIIALLNAEPVKLLKPKTRASLTAKLRHCDVTRSTSYPHSCGLRWLCVHCGMKARRAEHESVERQIGIAHALQRQRPELDLRMLTLTVPHGPNTALRASFDKLQQGHRTLLRWRARDTSEYRKIVGGVSHFDAQPNADGTFHPHLHVIALIDGVITEDRLLQDWRSATHDPAIAVVLISSPARSVSDLIGYALRSRRRYVPNAAQRRQLFMALSGKRLNGAAFGAFKNMPTIQTSNAMRDFAATLSGPHSWCGVRERYRCPECVARMRRNRELRLANYVRYGDTGRGNAFPSFAM